MIKMSFAVFFCGLILTNTAVASEVIWKGQVSSDGNPTKTIDLTMGKKYQIIVNGSVNLGKWVQGGKELADDAGFEYNGPTGISQSTTTFRNSSDIPLENKTYNSDHLYKSKPFVAKQTKIHFWVFDTDYGDNSGNFDVQLIQLD